MTTSVSALENKIFFKRWLKNPGQLGTWAPITHRFARYAASIIEDRGGYAVEVGAGTGRLTRYLLNKVPSDRLAINELDPQLCQFLRDTLPDIKVMEGDACGLNQMLPSSWLGEVGTLVSVIPLMYLPKPLRLQIVEACFSTMKDDGIFYQVTYSPISPLKDVKTILGRPLKQKRVGSLWLNAPPGFVWSYELD